MLNFFIQAGWFNVTTLLSYSIRLFTPAQYSVTHVQQHSCYTSAPVTPHKYSTPCYFNTMWRMPTPTTTLRTSLLAPPTTTPTTTLRTSLLAPPTTTTTTTLRTSLLAPPTTTTTTTLRTSLLTPPTTTTTTTPSSFYYSYYYSEDISTYSYYYYYYYLLWWGTVTNNSRTASSNFWISAILRILKPTNKRKRKIIIRGRGTILNSTLPTYIASL